MRMKFEMEGEGAPRRLLVCVAGRKEEGQGPKGWWWCWWVGRCHPDHSCLAPLPCFCPALWRLAALSGRTRPQLLVRECCRVRVPVRAQCMLLIRRSINYESCPFGSHIILCVCIFFLYYPSCRRGKPASAPGRRLQWAQMGLTARSITAAHTPPPSPTLPPTGIDRGRNSRLRITSNSHFSRLLPFLSWCSL